MKLFNFWTIGVKIDWLGICRYHPDTTNYTENLSLLRRPLYWHLPICRLYISFAFGIVCNFCWYTTDKCFIDYFLKLAWHRIGLFWNDFFFINFYFEQILNNNLISVVKNVRYIYHMTDDNANGMVDIDSKALFWVNCASRMTNTQKSTGHFNRQIDIWSFFV